MKSTTTRNQRETIYRLHHEYGIDWKLIYPLFPDIPTASQRRIAKTWHDHLQRETIKPSSHQITTESNGSDVTVTSKSKTIKTLEQLVEAADIDLSKWEITNWVANAWEQGQKGPDGEPNKVTLHQVKASLKKSQDYFTPDFIADLRADLQQEAPEYPEAAYPVLATDTDTYMLELSIPDLHFGKYSWLNETGQPYNMDIAEDLFVNSIFSLVSKSAHLHIGKILLPLGNDLFNIDNLQGTTSKGTPQSSEGDIRQHFRRVRLMIRDVVDQLVNIAPVEIIIVPGNHDQLVSYFLGEALEDWYYKCPNVTVNNGPTQRKYVTWGINLLGFTHGDKIKLTTLPLLMAGEQAHNWDKPQYREWHIGHRHTEKEVQLIPTIEIDGVNIRTIPSLSAADTWHDERAFNLNTRCAQSFLWSQTEGLAGQHRVNVFH